MHMHANMYRYLGFQVTGMTIQYLITFFLTFVLIVPIAIVVVIAIVKADIVESAFEQIRSSVLMPLLTVCIIVAFQVLFVQMLFYEGSGRNQWIKNIFWFSFFDYILVFNNMLVGLVVVIARYGTCR